MCTRKMDVERARTTLQRTVNTQLDGHQAKNLKAFYTPIWHLAKEDELENLHDKQKKMHPGDAYIYNINNKKKIYKYIKEKYIASMLSISRMHKIPQKDRKSLKIAQEIYFTMWHKMMIHTMLS